MLSKSIKDLRNVAEGDFLVEGYDVDPYLEYCVFVVQIRENQIRVTATTESVRWMRKHGLHVGEWAKCVRNRIEDERSKAAQVPVKRILSHGDVHGYQLHSY